MHPACPGLLLLLHLCQPRLLAASEGSSEDVLGSRNVSSAFLQCSCFLGFSQHVAELHSLLRSLSRLCAGVMRSLFCRTRERRAGKVGWQVVLSRLPRYLVCVEHWAACCDCTGDLKGALPLQGLALLQGCASQLLEDTSSLTLRL